MSASASKVSSLSDEQIINRWGFDYYVFKALSAFRDADYTAFTHFTSIIENLVVRPVDGHSDMIVKLRCMQFLSRINNGDKLDLTFEEPKTPLESAVSVLESICRDMSVPPREQERVKQAIIETLIMVCLRSGEFTRAEEVLLRHFSDAADSAGKKKLFESLIRRRRSSHSVLQLSSYADFKQDMLDFIERLYRVPEPFLLQMLKRSGHPGISSEPVTSSSQDRQKTSAAAEHHGGVCARLSLHSLRQVYGVLSERYGVSVSFTQLQQELEEEQEQEESPELHLALSETPREQPEPPYAGMTISRLVQEDDSQLSTAEEEETQISSPHRIVIPSGPDSDDPEVRTPVRRSDTHNHSSECSPAQICTPARHTQKHNRIVLSSDVEAEDHAASPPSSRRSSRHKQQQKSDHSESKCVMVEDDGGSSAQVCSPARPSSSSSSPAVRRSARDTQRQSRIVLSSDVEPEDHATSPPSSRRSSRHKQQQKSVHRESKCVMVEVEDDGGSSAQVCSPARPSSSSSSSPAVRRSARDTQRQSRIVLSSDVEPEDHATSPPSSRRSSRHKQQQKSDHSESECVMEVEDGGSCVQHSTPARPSATDTQRHNRSVTVSSESEDHNSSPAPQTPRRRSSPSSGGAHKRRRARWQDVSGTHENWSDEESLFSATSGRSSKKYSRKMWTVQESEWLKEGVRRFGAGHWEKIRSSFPFTGRTAVNLKDRWRTMLKLRLV
ncbi:telomeric repeat binding factor a isoform X2 [Cyprinus carpio]|uniref:Telomeric repeat binding factor a isoform X2 n=1 Tax=Cyprinus carpio TaxID=7962 RepID=A0A9Q9W7Y2_CYPCA|nr:telomeric repeat binding factor a isoform X2 [Cyprinus carpio]